MSDNSTLGELGQEVISQFSPVLTLYYISLASGVLLLYDYFLTFPLEVSEIWSGKFTITKTVFCLNRYASLVYLLNLNLNLFFKPATNLLFTGIAVNSIFILRTFAIYDRNRIIFVLLTIPALGTVTSEIWQTIITPNFAFPQQLQIGPSTCYFNSNSSFFERGSGSLFNWLSDTIFDVLVIFLTVYRVVRLAIESRRAGIKHSLSFILLRDGIFYYSVIFLPEFVQICINGVLFKSDSANLSFAQGDLGVIFGVLQTIILNHLVLNLAHTANSQGNSFIGSRSAVGSLVFAGNEVLGNIGGPLRVGSDDDFGEEPDVTDDTDATDLSGRAKGDLDLLAETCLAEPTGNTIAGSFGTITGNIEA